MICEYYKETHTLQKLWVPTYMFTICANGGEKNLAYFLGVLLSCYSSLKCNFLTYEYSGMKTTYIYEAKMFKW